MTEMDPLQAAMDNLLRRSMAAPTPRLSPDFDQRVMRELQRGSGPSYPYRRILLTGYGLTSVVASVVVMRGQGLNWVAASLSILAPLALVAAAGWAWRLPRTLLMRSAKQS